MMLANEQKDVFTIIAKRHQACMRDPFAMFACKKTCNFCGRAGVCALTTCSLPWVGNKGGKNTRSLQKCVLTALSSAPVESPHVLVETKSCFKRLSQMVKQAEAKFILSTKQRLWMKEAPWLCNKLRMGDRIGFVCSSKQGKRGRCAQNL